MGDTEMTLFASGPDIIDIPRDIVDVLQPLQEKKFKCDKAVAEAIWRLLKRYSPCEFYYHNLDKEHHLGGRGVQYVRTKEAAITTHRVFRLIFGRRWFKKVKEEVLQAVLCEACGMANSTGLSSDETKKGREFFRAWHREMQKLLPEPLA